MCKGIAEARHSRRVADLLIDVFGIADPLRPGDRTGLDMVEQAVARVAAYPELRPTIRADLGRIFDMMSMLMCLPSSVASPAPKNIR